jgi:segregation and condensation protein B
MRLEPVSGPSLKQIVEAILFASNTPVTLKSLREIVSGDEAPRLAEVIEELQREYEAGDRGVHIVALAGGYQILSREECAEPVEKYLKARRKARLSRAALETLAIIAYRQPVTKVEIDKIRGVDVGGVVGTLLERRLIVIKGRAKGVGSPLLYGTTTDFLTTFGLNRLDDLPRLDEMEGIVGDQAREALLAAREAAGITAEDLELAELGESEDGELTEIGAGDGGGTIAAEDSNEDEPE